MGQSCCQQMGMDGKNYEAIRVNINEVIGTYRS